MSDAGSSSTSSSTSTMSRMRLHSGFRGFYTRVHKIIGLRRKQEKRRLEISAPFNFQKVSMDIAGISADELSLLKEQAVASRIGISDPEDDARPSLLKSASGPIVSVVPVAGPFTSDGPLPRQTSI